MALNMNIDSFSVSLSPDQWRCLGDEGVGEVQSHNMCAT